MREITNLHDRDLYAPLRQYLNPDHEPMQGPQPVVRLVHPAPAEAATDVGQDDEGDRSRDLPEGAGFVIAAAVVGFVAALAMGWHMLARFFA